MGNFIRILSFLLVVGSLSGSADRVASQTLQGNIVHHYVDVGRFVHTSGLPYVEIYVAVDGSSLRYLPGADGLFRGKVELELKMHSNRGVAGNNWAHTQIFVTPAFQDSSRSNKRFFLPMQFTRSLAADSLTLEVHVRDSSLVNSSVTSSIREIVVEPAPVGVYAGSDVVFIERLRRSKDENDFTKYGMEILPLVSNGTFYNQDTLRFYQEHYHLDRLTDKPFYFEVSLSEANHPRPIPAYVKKYRSGRPDSFLYFSGSFEIDKLTSQTYFLNIVLKSEDGALLAMHHKKLFIVNDRIGVQYAFGNDINYMYDRLYSYSEAELEELLPTMSHISSDAELSMAGTLRTYQEKKNYFYSFWESREPDRTRPGLAWREYYHRVEYAGQNFASHQPGWRTDRGRVLLKYGIPNDIQKFPFSANQLPYMIWTYNKLRSQTGVIFVFVDSDLATDSYPLAHSTLMGETYNANWRANLMRAKNKNYGLDPDTDDPQFKETTPATTGAPR